MTSTNDGKDVKTNQTSGQKGKTYYIELYKSLEGRLSGECSSEERTRLVCEAWCRVHSLCLHSAPSTHPHLLSWLQRHTSHTILQTEWQSPKSKEQHSWLEDAINAAISECQEAASKRNGVSQPWETQLRHRARWFLTVLPNPWGHHVLKALLDSQGPQPSDKEVLEWLKEERGVMFVTRLRQLAASKCDDLALLLATAVMSRVRHTARVVADVDQAEEPKDKLEVPSNEPTFQNILRKEAGFTQEVWDLLTDIEFVLLYKGQSRARCIELAKLTPLRNGYQLVGRLQNRLENSPQDKKLWKNAKDVATLIAQVVIARCMVLPKCAGVAREALYGCVYSLVQLLPADKLPTAAAALAAPAATSRHLHTLAAAVHAQCKEERKPFVCSLYVRAITAGMNELEKLKLDSEKESEARSIEQILASWFVQIGTLLSESVRLSYECVLTAFSVHPSPNMYEMVKRAPVMTPLITPDTHEKDPETNSEFGSWANDSRTHSNLVKTSETLNLKHTQKQGNVLSTTIFAEGEGLGLEADLCQDLAVLLSGPRVKTLYWDLDREVLLENCRAYMERTHGGTRALITELKYLNLDPNTFMHLPEEEDEDENNIYYGIEKGYEHLVEIEEPEPEKILYNEFLIEYTDSTESASSADIPFIIPKRKKKKSKRPPSEEEVDPLSIASDTLSEKNERSHSKERSKHKKDKGKKVDSTKEHDENTKSGDINKEVQKKEKKKEKKERKKKDKITLADIKLKKKKSSSNLSRLVGMKIIKPHSDRRNASTNVNNACITDSDYDSQGKSSINSECNDNFLMDGLYSIDDINPPEKTNNTLTDNSQRTSFPLFSYAPETASSAQKDIKRGIQKLIEYRRHRALNENSISQDSPENQTPNNNSNSQTSSSNTHSPAISSKGVNLPDSTTTSANKQVSRVGTNTNFPYVKKSLKAKGISSNRTVKKSHPSILSSKNPLPVVRQTANKFADTPSQKQFQEFLLQRKWNSVQDQILSAELIGESVGQIQFQEFIKKQYLRESEEPVQPSHPQASELHDQSPPKTYQAQDNLKQQSDQITKNISPSQKQFHNFLKELQMSINAGATNDMHDSKSSLTNDKPATKKIIQPKKVDNAVNTYSRLSYMHKNKQCDNKIKSASNQITHNKHLVNVTPEQIQHIKDIDIKKVSHLQSTGQIILSKVDKPRNKCTNENTNTKVLVQTIENISGLNSPSNNPVISNILLSNSVNNTQNYPGPQKNEFNVIKQCRKQSISSCSVTSNSSLDIPVLSNTMSSEKLQGTKNYLESVKNEIKVTQQCNKPTSNLSEKDQLDLLLLLRQQNHLKPPTIQVNRELPRNNPSASLNKPSSVVNTDKQCLSSPQSNVSFNSTSELSTKSCPTSVIKVINNKTLSSGSEPKQNRKGSKQKAKTESDWKSVMDDLLARKTPSSHVGPNALDIVLKKDSFEKRSSDNFSNPHNEPVTASSVNPNISANNDNIVKQPTLKTNANVSTSNESVYNLKPALLLTDMKQKEFTIIQSTNKLPSSSFGIKKELLPGNVKHLPCIIRDSTDPFISGIPNSDYDLLEELMDDDLRQEIGELSSDDESYRSSNLSTAKNNLQVKETNPLMDKSTAININTTGNTYNYKFISGSTSVKKPSNTNDSDIKKGLPAKNISLSISKVHKNPAPNNDASSKPRILSNELITSSTLLKKPLFEGKCQNVSSTKLSAPGKNTCQFKQSPVTTMRKTKIQKSDNISANICNNSNLDIRKAHKTNIAKASQVVLDPAQVVLTVPQRNTAQNVMLIGTDFIYDPFSTVHVNQSANSSNFSESNSNTYVAINQVPMNVALLQTTPIVAPVLSPVIIERSISSPVIQNVPVTSSLNLTLPNCEMRQKFPTCKEKHFSPMCKDDQHINKLVIEPIQTKAVTNKNNLGPFKLKATDDDAREFNVTKPKHILKNEGKTESIQSKIIGHTNCSATNENMDAPTLKGTVVLPGTEPAAPDLNNSNQPKIKRYTNISAKKEHNMGASTIKPTVVLPGSGSAAPDLNNSNQSKIIGHTDCSAKKEYMEASTIKPTVVLPGSGSAAPDLNNLNQSEIKGHTDCSAKKEYMGASTIKPTVVLPGSGSAAPDLNNSNQPKIKEHKDCSAKKEYMEASTIKPTVVLSGSRSTATDMENSIQPKALEPTNCSPNKVNMEASTLKATVVLSESGFVATDKTIRPKILGHSNCSRNEKFMEACTVSASVIKPGTGFTAPDLDNPIQPKALDHTNRSPNKDNMEAFTLKAAVVLSEKGFVANDLDKTVRPKKLGHSNCSTNEKFMEASTVTASVIQPGSGFTAPDLDNPIQPKALEHTNRSPNKDNMEASTLKAAVVLSESGFVATDLDKTIRPKKLGHSNCSTNEKFMEASTVTASVIQPGNGFTAPDLDNPIQPKALEHTNRSPNKDNMEASTLKAAVVLSESGFVATDLDKTIRPKMLGHSNCSTNEKFTEASTVTASVIQPGSGFTAPDLDNPIQPKALEHTNRSPNKDNMEASTLKAAVVLSESGFVATDLDKTIRPKMLGHSNCSTNEKFTEASTVTASVIQPGTGFTAPDLENPIQPKILAHSNCSTNEESMETSTVKATVNQPGSGSAAPDLDNSIQPKIIERTNISADEEYMEASTLKSVMVPPRSGSPALNSGNSTPVPVSNRNQSESVQMNIKFDKQDTVVEVPESYNLKSNIKLSHHVAVEKSDRKVLEDIRGPTNAMTVPDTLLDKKREIDIKVNDKETDISNDQARMIKKRTSLVLRQQNIVNCCNKNPIALPYASIKSFREENKDQEGEFQTNQSNINLNKVKRISKTKRGFSGKTDVVLRQSIRIAKNNRNNRDSEKRTSLAIPVHESVNLIDDGAKKIDKTVENKFFSKIKNLLDINHSTVVSKGVNEQYIESSKINLSFNHGSKEVQVCKDRNEEPCISTKLTKESNVISNDNGVLLIADTAVNKISCQEIDESTYSEKSAWPSSNNTSNEYYKKDPIGEESKSTSQKLPENYNLASVPYPYAPLLKESNTNEVLLEKTKICTENLSLIDDSENMKSVDLEKQTTPAVINMQNKTPENLSKDNLTLANKNVPHTKSNDNVTLVKSKNNITLVGKNVMPQENKIISISKNLNSTIKKSDASTMGEITSVVKKVTPHREQLNPLPSENSKSATSYRLETSTKLPVVGKKLVPQEQQSVLIASLNKNTSTNTSDQLCKDKVSFVRKSIKPQEKNTLNKIKNTRYKSDVTSQEEQRAPQLITETIDVEKCNKKLPAQKIPTAAELAQEILGIRKPKENVNRSAIKHVNTQPGPYINKNKKTYIYKDNVDKDSKLKNDLSNARISIEDVPNAGDGPLKRCLRIKLPNGNTFKATISGKINVNIDSIFDDPVVKSLLWKNMNNNTKCLLNIKQVSIQNKNEEILKTEVKNIIYPKSNFTTTTEEAETIDLISDDEEDDSPKTFKTEFGNFNISSLDPSIHEKHQKKFAQKSVVVLERCNVLKKVTPESQEDKSYADINVSKGNLVCTSQEIITDYIEIDDSSNDSISLISSVSNTNENKIGISSEKVNELKHLLLKDLGVLDTDEVTQTERPHIEVNNKNTERVRTNNNIIGTKKRNLLNSKNNIIEQIDNSKDMPTNESDINIEEAKEVHVETPDSSTCHIIESNSKQFLLKIKKCDDLAEQLLRIQKYKCFVRLTRCDETFQSSGKKINFNKKFIEKSFDGVQNLEDKTVIDELSLKRSDSLSILTELNDANPDEIFAPMSPSLIGNFEIPSNLIETHLNSCVFVGSSSKICDADWFMTKSILNKYDTINNSNPVKIFESREDNEDSLTDCSDDVDLNFSTNKSYQVPSLLKLNIDFLAKNSDVVDKLINKDLTSRNVMNSSPLRRKSSPSAELFGKIEKGEDTLTYCCDDLDVNFPTDKSYQVPSLLKLNLDFLNKNSDVVDELINGDVTSRNVMNSSPLKRKCTPSVETFEKIEKYEDSVTDCSHDLDVNCSIDKNCQVPSQLNVDFLTNSSDVMDKHIYRDLTPKTMNSLPLIRKSSIYQGSGKDKNTFTERNDNLDARQRTTEKCYQVPSLVKLLVNFFANSSVAMNKLMNKDLTLRSEFNSSPLKRKSTVIIEARRQNKISKIDKVEDISETIVDKYMQIDETADTVTKANKENSEILITLNESDVAVNLTDYSDMAHVKSDTSDDAFQVDENKKDTLNENKKIFALSTHTNIQYSANPSELTSNFMTRDDKDLELQENKSNNIAGVTHDVAIDSEDHESSIIDLINKNTVQSIGQEPVSNVIVETVLPVVEFTIHETGVSSSTLSHDTNLPESANDTQTSILLQELDPQQEYMNSSKKQKLANNSEIDVQLPVTLNLPENKINKLKNGDVDVVSDSLKGDIGSYNEKDLEKKKSSKEFSRFFDATVKKEFVSSPEKSIYQNTLYKPPLLREKIQISGEIERNSSGAKMNEIKDADKNETSTSSYQNPLTIKTNSSSTDLLHDHIDEAKIVQSERSENDYRCDAIAWNLKGDEESLDLETKITKFRANDSNDTGMIMESFNNDTTFITESTKTLKDLSHNNDKLVAASEKSENNNQENESTRQAESNPPGNSKLRQNVTLVYKGHSNVILKGSIYEDPVVGTCYVFPVINKSITPEINSDNVCDDRAINIIETLKRKAFEDCNELNIPEYIQTIENLKVILPKFTYSRQRFKNNDVTNTGDKTNRKFLKRKLSVSCCENNHGEKRYRKGKNIDYPKFSVVTVLESGYTKEYKRLMDYCTSVKFSYSRPFHKEYIDVPELLKNWPIKENEVALYDDTDFKHVIFTEDQFEIKAPFDPLQQTLAEEISQCKEQPYFSDYINETNFNMGFGEGSDRVIQISEDENIISKVSAATLSDVKQSQPFLTSEDYIDSNKNKILCMSNEHQIDILKRSFTYIQLRDKVRAFFKKTAAELNYNWFIENMKSNYKNSCNNSVYLKSGFPYDLVNTEFIEPAPVEAIVQVVQVGQLPVNAAAQNPVTCDPRVTQVTDASPQCSIENSPHDDSQSPIKTEYTELTTADLSLPLVQEYDRQMESQESSKMPNSHHEDIPVETEITSIVKTEITVELSPMKEEPIDYNDSDDLQSLVNKHINNVDYSFDSNDNSILEPQSNTDMSYESLDNHEPDFSPPQEKQQNGSTEKTDQIAHAMNAAGITTTPETMVDARPHSVVNMLPQKNCQQVPAATTTSSANSYSKPPINAMTLQQALAQILPPPLNQTNVHENNHTSSTATPQVLHIVQGKNTNGNQITLVDNTQNSVINNTNTPMLHIVQSKGANTNSTPNPNSGQHTNSYSGLSLVDAGIQQGSNQLLHIVNAGNQKNNTTGQLLKRVNLLTNLANVQGSNEQKMVQFVCKSADGKSIHLNAPHQRSMVLRLQPIESNIQPTPKTTDSQENTTTSPSSSNNNNNVPLNKESTNGQHEIKSRSVYEENYAKFIQNSSNKTVEKSTSLPKFGQAFGKQVYQDGNQKSNEINANSSNMTSINTNSENAECQPNDNSVNLDQIGQMNSPPLLLRKSPSQPAQTQPSQSNLVQQIKQTIAPMNIQTMHGGVIYTRQIPVNIGGGQTINLITVPSTELLDDQKQKANQNELESQIIKIVPQNQNTQNAEGAHDDGNNHTGASNESAQGAPTQHQPVLTQMRIKLPMLSKTPQMVSGGRVVRPSFFQIQRNVIGGANQHVYQQLVLTAAPPLGQHTIRLPQAQASRPVTNTNTKTTTEGQSTSEHQMSSSTLEQLREFDMVLEQVKERSTVQPNSNNTFTKLLTPTTESSESTSVTSTVTEPTQQVLYSIGSNQSLNVAYINRKTVAATPTTSTFVRSPDSSGIIDSPSSSHVQIPHTVTSESTVNEASAQPAQPAQPKPAKVGSKSKSRPKSSSNPPSSLKINTLPPKPSTQKPLEDEQTTQRILYILAEYKEQVENSPDKDKPAPRRRSNPPTNPSGSSKRKKSSSGSRRPGARDISPVHGEDTCRTMGSEDSSCGTSQGDCNETCLDSHSPQDSPRKVVRKLTFENETSPATQQPRPQPQRNVIVADGQTITVARGTAGKPATAVLMPANYILPVSMVKGGQQIAIVTNRGPKLLTVGGGEGGATNALLLQRLIGPAGLKPVLTRPGVRHVRLPTAALHNLQAFNLTTATTVQPPDSTASPAPAPTPPELVETRANASPWTDREKQDVKPERESSPEGSEPWNIPSTADPQDYTYEETVRTDNMDRTVLEAIPDRYSPDMEAQRIFDKMFDVESKKSYIDSHDDSSRCAYDIDDDKVYHQVVHKKDGTSQRHHRLTHVSAAALRHKYAILEHELRLQKSLSEECEDLGVDSPSASELFPEAELLFAASPAHDAPQHPHTPQPTILNQSGIPQPDIDDQIATDELLQQEVPEEQQELDVTTLGLDEGIVTVSEDGMQATIALDQEEFARSHPNTTFHSSEPTDEGEVQPFTIAGLKGRHITSTIFHAGRAPATVLVTAPQTTVISQATPDQTAQNNVKYANMDQIINSSPSTHGNIMSSVLVKDDGLTKFDNILTDSRELHLSNTASAIVHSTGNATQVIRRVCYEDDKRDARFLMDEPDALIAGDYGKIAEDSSRDATLESIAGDDDNSSPERHAELFWESNSASERSESRRPMDFSSDSEKCCKSPSYDETNSTDSSGVGTHMRLDSVIKEARGVERSGSADGSSADDTHPPLRTYPAKRMYHAVEAEMERSVSGKTRAGERSPDNLEGRRRASGRGVVKRGCHCCTGSPPRPKKPRQRKPTMDFNN